MCSMKLEVSFFGIKHKTASLLREKEKSLGHKMEEKESRILLKPLEPVKIKDLKHHKGPILQPRREIAIKIRASLPG